MNAKKSLGSLAALACLLTPSLSAQQASPSAGQEDRPIKAVSDAEIMGYLNGEGMGFAKAAELNRYPGPQHVLDISDSLGLTEPQKHRIQAIYDTMHLNAVRLGTLIVAREAAWTASSARAPLTMNDFVRWCPTSPPCKASCARPIWPRTWPSPACWRGTRSSRTSGSGDIRTSIRKLESTTTEDERGLVARGRAGRFCGNSLNPWLVWSPA